MERRSDAAVLASGGLDSLVLLGWARSRHRRVQPIYIRFGLRWERAELHALRRILAGLRPGLPLAVLDLPAKDLYGSHWSLKGPGVPGRASPDRAVYLPGRNILLLAKAAVYCAARGIRTIYIGSLAANPFPDATAVFYREISRLLSRGLGVPVKVRAPFLKLRKEQVLRLGRRLPLRLAFSCLRPRGLRPCGACNKCEELERGLGLP